MRIPAYTLFALSLILLPSTGPAASPQQGEVDRSETYRPVDTYGAERNPSMDLDAALREANRSRRNVLLEVGGEWCSWCHIMDKFFADHRDLLALREKNFVTLKINMSPENENQAFLSQYPKIPGYPHLFVLDASNKLLKSQGTSELEAGNSYNLARFTEFLRRFSPAR